MRRVTFCSLALALFAVGLAKAEDLKNKGLQQNLWVLLVSVSRRG